ncbi:Protein phosphatase 2C-like protein 1 [Yarrowia sp. C11]|nr:Protein phosphatase 2C-like protein 1 [Yarrowia sp. C11]
MLKLFRRNSKDEAKSHPMLANNNGLPVTDSPLSSFAVGVTEDKNSRCRRTMEDYHVAAHNICGTPDSGLFAVFDGHAGKQAAEYCAAAVVGEVEGLIMESEGFKGEESSSDDTDVVREEGLEHQDTDRSSKTVPELLNLAFMAIDRSIEEKNLNSGCTAAVALLRWEDSRGKPVTVSSDHSPKDYTPVFPRAPASECKRKLYTANVGDTRLILCRAGKALRLSYDHKGTDLHESKRVTNNGGMMISNRVNGMLAVTRALGDTYMKQFIIGNPYTTETEIIADDEFLIVACDGLWDVCDDQKACDLVSGLEDPVEGSRVLVEFALENFSTDNLTVMVVRLR